MIHCVRRQDDYGTVIEARLYRKRECEDFLFVSLYNGGTKDIKLTYKLHAAHPLDSKVYTAYIKGKHTWGGDREIGYHLDDEFDRISIVDIVIGQIREYEEINFDEDGVIGRWKVIEFEKDTL